MTELTIKIGGEYLNASDEKVFIVALTTPDNIEYVESYPYLGADGTSYSEVGASVDGYQSRLVSEINKLPDDFDLEEAERMFERGHAGHVGDENLLRTVLPDDADWLINTNNRDVNEDDQEAIASVQAERDVWNDIEDRWGKEDVQGDDEPLIDFDEIFRRPAPEPNSESAGPETFEQKMDNVDSSVFILEEGHYYRNGLGQVVLIIGTIIPGTKWYKKGYRFCDHRNSFYLTRGSVNSRIFAQLDLVEYVKKEDLTPAEEIIIADQLDALDRKIERMEKVVKFCKVALPIASGLDIGIGLAIIHRSLGWGLFSIGSGIGGMVGWKKAYYPNKEM